jgi:hypothetical protein
MPDDPKPPTAADQRRMNDAGYSPVPWKGTTIFKCDTCIYDSTDEAKVAAHVQSSGHQEG